MIELERLVANPSLHLFILPAMRLIYTAFLPFILFSLASCGLQTKTMEVVQQSASQLATPLIGDTVAELGNNIMVVFQDMKGNHWFGSWVDGLYRFDGKAIVQFTTDDGLSDNRIDEIKGDDSGNVYVSTPKGVNKYDGMHFSTLPVDRFDQTWRLEPGDLWFRKGAEPGFVWRFDGNFLHQLKVPTNPIGEEYIRTHPGQRANPYDIYTIYEDTRGHVWFGTGALGAFCFDGVGFNWISEPDMTELHDGPSNGIRSIMEDEEGYFWFNTMYRYEVRGKIIPGNETGGSREFYRRVESIGSLDKRQDGGITEYLSITKDNAGDLWIATYLDGVWRYDGRNIIHYRITDGSKDITVFSIYKDNGGDLWLGTHENGAFKFNGKTFDRFNP